MPADVVSTLGREYFDDLVAGAEEEPKPHYASGGLVGGIRPGQGLANFASGFRDGQMDYRRMKAFDEDQEYKKTQRAREAQAYEMQQELYNAAGQVAATSGLDAKPLIDIYHKRFPNAAKLDFAKNDDGTFLLTTLYPDGKTESKAMKPEEVKVFSKEMAQGLSNPANWFKATEPTNDYTPIGGGLGVLNRKTGKVGPGLDPDTLRSVRSRSPAGPKAVRYPQRGMVLDAEDLLSTDPDLAGLSEEDRKALALNVASRAQGLLGEQPGIDASEAIAQALDEERTNVTSGEKREHFGLDWLARDVAPTYQDRRRVPVTVTPAEQALKAKMNARANPRTPAMSSPTEPTAVNPKTGERIVYRNGQWQPLR